MPMWKERRRGETMKTQADNGGERRGADEVMIFTGDSTMTMTTDDGKRWCMMVYGQLHAWIFQDFRVKTTIQLYTNIMYYRNLKNRTIDAFEGWLFFKIIIIIIIKNARVYFFISTLIRRWRSCCMTYFQKNCQTDDVLRLFPYLLPWNLRFLSFKCSKKSQPKGYLDFHDRSRSFICWWRCDYVI